MSAESLAASSDLIFQWRRSRQRYRSIASFLLVSLALHAVAFYTFQIVYPPAVALLPAPGRVSVISPATPEGRLVLRWIEAEDPALAATTQRPADAKMYSPPRIAHVQSFTTYQPALRELPPLAPDVRAPDPQPPGPVPQRRAPAAAPLPPVKTHIDFADAAELGDAQLPDMQFKRSSKESPQAAHFRIGVSPDGEICYSFLQNSSGDAALDEQAARYLALCRFTGAKYSAAGSDLVWTSATIVWGSDVAAPKNSP